MSLLDEEAKLISDCWDLVDLGPRVAYWRGAPPPRPKGHELSTWAKDMGLDKLAENIDSAGMEDVWKPEVGDMIQGIALEVDWVESKFEGQGHYPILTLETENGVKKFFGSHASAKEQLKSQNVQKNDGVVIKLAGTYKTKYGKDGYDYKVAVLKRDKPPTEEYVHEEMPVPVNDDGIPY